MSNEKMSIMLSALEDITKVEGDSPVKIYQRMEDIARDAIKKVNAQREGK